MHANTFPGAKPRVSTAKLVSIEWHRQPQSSNHHFEEQNLHSTAAAVADYHQAETPQQPDAALVVQR
jgi:hypothetical protein